MLVWRVSLELCPNFSQWSYPQLFHTLFQMVRWHTDHGHGYLRWLKEFDRRRWWRCCCLGVYVLCTQTEISTRNSHWEQLLYLSISCCHSLFCTVFAYVYTHLPTVLRFKLQILNCGGLQSSISKIYMSCGAFASNGISKLSLLW